MSRWERTRGPKRAPGYSMPALLAMLAIMTLALMLAMPSWRYLVQDDKEQELIFRGGQISAAIARFQRKNGNALPTSFEQLVKGKYLRQEFKDPMTKDGKWRIVRPGEVAPTRPAAGAVGGRPGATPSPTPAPTPGFGGGSGGLTGPIAGVASLSRETSLRTVNGNVTYNLWVFTPSIPLVIGGQAPTAGPRPGAPNPLPASARTRAPDAEAPRLSR